MECKGVLIRVRGGVVGLAAVSGHAYERGEHDEEIHVVGKNTMQVPTTLDLRRHDFLPVVDGHVLESGITKVHRALDDTTDWGEGGTASRNNLLKLAKIADIALINADLDTLSSETGHKRHRIWVMSS